MFNSAVQELENSQNVWQRVGTLFATHHNRFQFVGYEVANIILVIHETSKSGMTAYGFNLETYAALFLLVGSACIWKFDPENRPQLLCLGGIALTIGGGFLVGAGYGLTGWAVILASMESARGGLLAWQVQVQTITGQGAVLKPIARMQLNLVQYLLGWYVWFVDKLSSRFHRVGQFINQRPFITGSLIKAPLRLEFIIKKIILGDWIGVGVGLSWMILGDGGLAFNDAALKAKVLRVTQPIQKIP